MDSRMEYLPKLYISEDIEDITPIKWSKVNPYIKVKKFEPHTICYFTTKEKENIMALSHLTKKELEEKVIELLENNEKLALLVKGKENTIERLASLTEELENENKRLNGTIKDMNMNLNMNYVHELEEKVKRAEGSKHEWELVAKSLNDDVATLKKRVEELIENNNKLGEDNKRLENEIRDMNGMYRARLKELVKNNNNLGNDVDRLTVENKDLKMRVDKLVMKNDELEDHLEKLTESKNRLLVDYRKDVYEFEARIRTLLAENEKFSDENHDLKRKLEEKEYIDTDIASTKALVAKIDVSEEVVKQMRLFVRNTLNSVYGSNAFKGIPANGILHPQEVYNVRARHIAAKVKALEDAGLSHDDAMGLIPLWDDEI